MRNRVDGISLTYGFGMPRKANNHEESKVDYLAI